MPALAHTALCLKSIRMSLKFAAVEFHRCTRLMDRIVEPEWLDQLPPNDPLAVESRRDLRRLNAWMGNVRSAARALSSANGAARLRHLTELGAGDGDFLLKLARQLGRNWSGTKALLLDRQSQISELTLAGFRALNWQTEAVTCDVLEWCNRAEAGRSAVVLANLFLHHFDAQSLAVLLQTIEARSDYFVALEPCRSRFALLFSNLVGFIGCNAVTRHDAPASVRAGFNGQELSRLWPNQYLWSISERPAWPFGHLFIAQRKHSTSPAL